MMGAVRRTRRHGRLGPVTTVAAASAAAMVLAGCGDVAADQAAVIDGQTVGESELQETTAQLNTIAAEPFTPSGVLSELTRAPFLDRAFAGTSVELTDQETAEFLAQNGLDEPTSLTVDVARARQYQTLLQDPQVMEDPAVAEAVSSLQEITVADIEALDVEINPRYGSFDAQTASVVSENPSWISSDD